VETVNLTCDAAAVDSPLTLVDLATDPAFGSTLLAGGGATIDTVLYSGVVTCEEQADLEVTKEAPATALAGSTVEYVVTVHNGGPNPAVSIIMGDDLPDDKDFVDAALAMDVDGDTSAETGPVPCVPGWMPSLDVDVTGDTVPEHFDNVVMCAAFPLGPPFDVLMPSQKLELTIHAAVPLAAAGKLEIDGGMAFSADPVTLLPLTEDPDISNNSAGAGTLVLPADVSIVKDCPPQSLVGDDLDCTITITSEGPSTASDVVVTDALSDKFSYHDADVVCDTVTATVDYAGSGTGGDVTVTVDAPMPVGEECVITLHLDCAEAGTTTNQAEVCWADPLCAQSNMTTTIQLPPFNGMIKDARPDLPGIQDQVNLWLCTTGPDCHVVDPDTGAEIGKGALDVADYLFLREDTDSPNDSDTDPEGLAAYEEQIKFDHKIFDVEVNDAGSDGLDNDADTVVDNIEESAIAGWRGNVSCDVTIVTENWIMFGCLSAGQQLGNPSPVGVWLKTISLTPDADMYLRIRPTKDNGVVRTIIDENCEVADIYASEPWPFTNAGLTEDCSDLTVTVRMLEGDVNLDCQVNVLDQQAIAFRYGASFGLLLYDPWYDLEPKLTDFDIDIKDLQFVFGRDGSTCQNPVPDQPPESPPP
jgi:uncharacterized repeat protein (TIGR01451 family)